MLIILVRWAEMLCVHHALVIWPPCCMVQQQIGFWMHVLVGVCVVEVLAHMHVCVWYLCALWVAGDVRAVYSLTWVVRIG